MGLIEETTAALREAGLTVSARRNPAGSADGVTGVKVKLTGTGVGYEGPLDLNNTVLPAGGVAYIKRDGSVWLLREGPARGKTADIWLAATTTASVTDEQVAARDAVDAQLQARYGLVAEDEPPSATEDSPGAED